MAYYAFLDENNIVTEVIVGKDNSELIDGISNWETYYGEIRGQLCKMTSTDGSFRKNYAGIGFEYKENLDAFIAPKNFQSWVLDEESCQWKAPLEYPNDGKYYGWSEFGKIWVELQD
jgi:CTP:phosphocholine cytidylyltransferase-like protein